MKNYLVYYIHRVICRGRIFSHIHKIKTRTISNISYMKYKTYRRQSMQMIERRLNMIIAKTPQIITSLTRTSDHTFD